MTRKGTGGFVKHGYLVVATVGAWKYIPEPPHVEPQGSGIIEVRLSNVKRSWLAQEDRFTLVLHDNRAALTFDHATLISDECFAVTSSPRISRA